MNTFDQKRMLALDVRPKSFGFVVFEGQTTLLDWGAKSFPRGVHAVRVPPRPKIRGLIAEYLPDALVIKRRRHGQSARMLGYIKQEAKAHRIKLQMLSPQAVKRVFVGRRNKDQRAAAIAEQFPELLSILPPRRKIWRSEDYRMKIFDAAALGVAYFTRGQQFEPKESVPPPAPPHK